MKVDVDINELRIQFEQTRQTIASLHKQGKVNSKDFEVSKKELTELNSGLNWSEKYFGGSFGGDKEKLKKIQSLKNKVSRLRVELRRIDSDLKSENSNVKDKVVDYLSKHSKKVKSLIADRNINQQLLVEIDSFIDILKKAKKEITDALLFTSWESLINHPKAQTELSKFTQLINSLELKINKYELQTGANLLNGNRLGNYIQFSTEKIAMDSFKKLNNSISEVSVKLANKLSEIDKEINSITEYIHQLLL